jgi:hypothetical protein
MPTATARIVVQATPQEKRTLTAKARNLGMSVSELMRSGAAAFDPAPDDLLALARTAREAMDRSMAAVDAAMASVAKSNARIRTMEARAVRASSGSNS